MIPASTQRVKKCRARRVGCVRLPACSEGLKDESRAGAGKAGGEEGLPVTWHTPTHCESRWTDRSCCLPGRQAWAQGCSLTVYMTAHPLALLVGGGPQPGPESVGRCAQVPRELVLTIHTDFHSQKALLFNKIFVAGKFCEFVC